jgi:hypothetical protein
VVGAYQGLDDWVDGISLNLLVLEALEGEEGFRLDFTGPSLERLERALVARFGPPDELADLVDGAAGYVGEVLLRVAGGGWGWRDDEPSADADEALDLTPVFARRLIVQAIAARTGHEFSDVYVTWEDAVARHRAANPGWAPTKKHTPGVDPFEMSPQDAAHIARWDAERRAAFSRWSETYRGDWDFGPASLDALEGLLARVTPAADDLRDPANQDFVEGAVWYFGEVIRRIRGGTWAYRTPDPEFPNIYAGQPYVHQAGQDAELVVPMVVLRKFLRGGTALRDRYRRCGGR